MIFLTGPHGAGKTTVAEMLTNHNFIYLDLGGILRRKHMEENPSISFESWCAENEKTKGSSFTDDIIVDEIKKTYNVATNAGVVLPQDLIIVGSRSLQGIQYVIEKVPNFNGRRNFIVYIDASPDVLIERYRSRENKWLTLAEFQALLEKDVKMGLLGIVSRADVRIFNNGSMQELRKKMQRLILNGLGYSK